MLLIHKQDNFLFNFYFINWYIYQCLYLFQMTQWLILMTLISGCPVDAEGQTRMYNCLKLPLYQNVFPLVIYFLYEFKDEWPGPGRFVLPRSFCVNTFPVAFLVSLMMHDLLNSSEYRHRISFWVRVAVKCYLCMRWPVHCSLCSIKSK